MNTGDGLVNGAVRVLRRIDSNIKQCVCGFIDISCSAKNTHTHTDTAHHIMGKTFSTRDIQKI